MRVYIGNIGHIKNHQNFKILFWSRESEKQIFTIFRIFLRTNGPGIWESRVRRPGLHVFWLACIPACIYAGLNSYASRTRRGHLRC